MFADIVEVLRRCDEAQTVHITIDEVDFVSLDGVVMTRTTELVLKLEVDPHSVNFELLFDSVCVLLSCFPNLEVLTIVSLECTTKARSLLTSA